MPIFRINDQLHYFAHVPKCGGTSVEEYLGQRFGKLAFQEPARNGLREPDTWNKTMVQHIPVAALNRMVPPDWFASSFATVRHPVRRLISIFHFWRINVRQIPFGADFNAWCQEAIPRVAEDPFRYDGHLLPQTAFVPKDARVFRLEDGLEPIVPYLDTLAGTTDGPRDIPALNIGKWRNDDAPPVPSPQTLDLVASFYATDFLRFGYAPPDTVEAAHELADLPALKATGKPPMPSQPSLVARLQRSLLKRAGL